MRMRTRNDRHLATRVVWVTNIPTPYRNLRYRLFQDVAGRIGARVDVFYMASSEPGRAWDPSTMTMDHRHRFFKGLHVKAGGAMLHFNPGLIVSLILRPPDVLVIGGYLSPTLWFIAATARRRTRVVLASESNTLEVRNRRFEPQRLVKRWMVRSADLFLGPGDMALSNLRDIDPASSSKPFIRLPNIVDDEIFGSARHQSSEYRNATRCRLGVLSESQMWLVPARLEPFKGILEFLEVVRSFPSVHLVIPGSGRLEEQIREAANRYSVPLVLPGQVSEREMVDLYAAANLFVLPSLRDPSPLSAVEAIAAGLPIWISSRAGNSQEVLMQSGENGWIYEPDAPESMQIMARMIGSLSVEQLSAMGAVSRQHYEASFQSDEWAESALRDLARRR